MNLPALRHLLALRYRLLWAQSRSRNGKIAMFMAGYLFIALLWGLLALGGLGAAIGAVKVGEAPLVARLVLAGIFVNAMVASVALGFGMNAVFTDEALRRYPIETLERLLARQALGILEPLWILVAAMYLGVAVGFYALAVGWLAWNVLAALGLLIANYLSARALLTVVERLMATNLGPMLMLFFVLSMSLMPALAMPFLRHNRALQDRLLQLLASSPPSAASSAMTADITGAALLHLGYLAAWVLALLALVFYFERHPMASRTVARVAARWGTMYDRISTHFGASGPLIGKAVRYYLRCNRVRYNMILALPLLGGMVRMYAGHAGQGNTFLCALGGFAILGFVGTAHMTVNQFGYDGGGIRRYFLLPAGPELAFRAASSASVLLGGLLIPVGITLWFFLAPVHTTPEMFFMLVASAIGGLLLLNALGLWTSLYSPRRAELSHNFGNNLSTGGNLLLIGAMVLCAVVPAFVQSQVRIGDVPRDAWVMALFLIASALFYGFTLRVGGRVFVSRRERLLAIVEGRG
jgi:hypothetical protein